MGRTAVRRTLWSLAGAVLLLQGLLVPMLEATGDARKVVLESEHSAASCVIGHDHSICIQAGANRAVLTSAIRHHLSVPALSFAATVGPTELHSVTPPPANRTRAPPSA